MKILTTIIAALAIAAPAHAYTESEAYAGGALYGVTCAALEGKATQSQAQLALAMTLRDRGIPESYAARPSVQKIARLMFVQRGGC